MQITVETITPTVAREYLRHNTKNRKARDAHVRNIARDIAAGAWRVNGDAIRFNCDGELLDGQHRLKAIVASDTAVQSVVIRGLEKDARVTMDAGAKRTSGDQMGLVGVANANAVAAACRYAMSARLNASMRPQSFTNSEIFRFYESHRSIAKDISQSVQKCPRGYGTIVQAIAHAIDFANPGESGPLKDAWMYGEGGRHHPCVVARERVIRDNASSGTSLIMQERMRLVAHSMVSAMRGETWKIARIPAKVWIPGWTAK